MERRLEATGLWHPLLAHPVANPAQCPGRSLLITGSNMAGKTTYLRTIGINVLLGQTLNLCLAEQAILPRAILRSSIRREDQLERGQSTYAVEIDRIGLMLHEAEQGPLYLFLIDEIFRGTNTVERVAGATAVLRHLGRSHLVLVTTHDLELQDLLQSDFNMVHFSEQITGSSHGFSYRLQEGPCRGRNAIRLLELHGYPMEVTKEARRLADKLMTT